MRGQFLYFLNVFECAKCSQRLAQRLSGRLAAVNAGGLLQCVKRCEHLAHWARVATTRRIAVLKVRIAVPSPGTC